MKFTKNPIKKPRAIIVMSTIIASKAWQSQLLQVEPAKIKRTNLVRTKDSGFGGSDEVLPRLNISLQVLPV